MTLNKLLQTILFKVKSKAATSFTASLYLNFELENKAFEYKWKFRCIFLTRQLFWLQSQFIYFSPQLLNQFSCIVTRVHLTLTKVWTRKYFHDFVVCNYSSFHLLTPNFINLSCNLKRSQCAITILLATIIHECTSSSFVFSRSVKWFQSYIVLKFEHC